MFFCFFYKMGISEIKSFISFLFSGVVWFPFQDLGARKALFMVFQSGILVLAYSLLIYHFKRYYILDLVFSK